MHRSARTETCRCSLSRNRLSVVNQLISATASARWLYAASPVSQLVSGILASSASRAMKLQAKWQGQETLPQLAPAAEGGYAQHHDAVNVLSLTGQGTTVAKVLSKAGGSSLISVSMVNVA